MDKQEWNEDFDTADETAALSPVDGKKFELLDCLGDGGMGPVYRARRNGDDGGYAVRVLSKDNGDAPLNQKLVEQLNAKIKLDHPGIATVHELVEMDEGTGIVYDYVDGISLRELLDRKEILTEDQALEIVAQIARALEHAWKNKIVHADIEPNNILLTPDGRICMLDYGVIKDTRRPHYMSLEQGKGRRKLDIRSDIYSVGILFYEMLAGQPPFEGNQAADVIQKHFHEPAPDLRIINPDVSAETYRVIRKMLAKGRSDRYQTPGELLEAIDEILPEIAQEEFEEDIDAIAASGVAAAGAAAALTDSDAETVQEDEDFEEDETYQEDEETVQEETRPTDASAAVDEEIDEDADLDDLFKKDTEEKPDTVDSLSAAAPSKVEEEVDADEDEWKQKKLEEEEEEDLWEEDEDEEDEDEQEDTHFDDNPLPTYAPRYLRREISTFPVWMPLTLVVAFLGIVYFLQKSSNEQQARTTSVVQQPPSFGRLNEEDSKKWLEMRKAFNKDVKKKRNLIGWFGKAQAFYEKHPNKFYMTRSFFEMVMNSAKKSELEGNLVEKCQMYIDEINKREEDQSNLVISSVREEAKVLASKGNYGEAIQLYHKIAPEDRSPTVETAILIATEALENQASKLWDEAKTKVKELTGVVVIPIEEQEEIKVVEPPTEEEMRQMRRRRNMEQEMSMEIARRTTEEALELEFAPSVEEIAQAKKIVAPFLEFGVHTIVVHARDYDGALTSLETRIITYQNEQNHTIEAEKRQKSKELYGELLKKSLDLLAHLKVWEVQKLCNDAVANDDYGYHHKKIKRLGKDAQAMSYIISIAKNHLKDLKGETVRVGTKILVSAKVKMIDGEDLILARGENTFRKNVFDLEPSLVYSLAKRSANISDQANYYRAMGIFAYYTKDYEAAAENFKIAQSKGADLVKHIGLITDVEIKVRDSLERKALTKAYNMAKKYYAKKNWALLKEQCIQIRLSFNDSDHYQKVKANVLDWLDLAYDHLEGKDEMVLISAGAYKNIFDEPVNVHAFYMDRYEVSNRQYAKFLRWMEKRGLSGSHIFCHQDEKQMYGMDGQFYASPEAMMQMGVSPGMKDHTPDGFDSYIAGWEDLPVTNLDWYDAYAYATWAGKRLPTVREYTRAVSGSDNRKWPFGKIWRPELCNGNDGGFNDGSKDGYRGIAPVKSFPKGRSPFGIFNLAGNVREFLNGVDSNIGGSYRDGKSMCSIESASRLQRQGMSGPPRLEFVGFRCVKDVQ